MIQEVIRLIPNTISCPIFLHLPPDMPRKAALVMAEVCTKSTYARKMGLSLKHVEYGGEILQSANHGFFEDDGTTPCKAQ